MAHDGRSPIGMDFPLFLDFPKLHAMPQSFSCIWIHLIFSTKERYPFLSTPDLRREMHDYLQGACRKMGCPPRIANGTADHVHVLCQLSRTISVADLLKGFKESSSKWVKSKGDGMLRKFQWQVGYGAFSVSPSRLAAVKHYIANQEEHHRTMTFKEELMKFLEEYDIEYEEEYL